MGSLIALLKAIDRGIAGVEMAVGVGATAGMLVLVLIPFALRAVGTWYEPAARLPGELFWMAPVSRFLLFWATFAGASLATRSRRHIAIDVVTKSLSGRARATAGVVAALVAAAFCAITAVVGAFVVRENWDQPEVLRGFYKGPVQLVIPIALAIMSFRFLITALEDLRGAITGAYLRAYEGAAEPGAHHGERPSEGAPEARGRGRRPNAEGGEESGRGTGTERPS